MEKICHVEKFQISVKNLKIIWSFIKIYAIFVLNLCGEKMTNMRSVILESSSVPWYPCHVLLTFLSFTRTFGGQICHHYLPANHIKFCVTILNRSVYRLHMVKRGADLRRTKYDLTFRGLILKVDRSFSTEKPEK